MAQIAKLKVTQRLQARGVRKLHRELNRQIGFRSSLIIICTANAFIILLLEELVGCLVVAPFILVF